MSLDVSDVYLVSEGFVPGALRVRARQALDEFAVLRGEFVPDGAVFEWATGNKQLDLVGTSYATLWLFSRAAIDALRRHSLTGWRTYSAKVLGRNGEEIGGYMGFAVTGRGGSIDHARSHQVTRPAPNNRGKPYSAWVGLHFDPSSWDGSDFFHPTGTGYVLASGRAKRVLEEAKLRNIKVEPAATIERLML